MAQEPTKASASVNFDPAAIMATVTSVVARIDAVETTVNDVLNVVGPIASVFSPFLPAPVGAALQELPELQAEMLRVKDFINNVLPQLGTLIGAAGVGATEAATIAANAPVVHTEAPAGALTPVAPPNPPAQTAAPKGAHYAVVNGKLALAEGV
jgi:hypothetical protein